MHGQFKNAVPKKIRATVTTLPLTQATAPDDDRTRILSDWTEARTRYLTNARRQGQSPSSQNVRGQRFGAFARWAEWKSLTPRDIRTSDVKLFIDYCQSLKQSNFTVNGKLRVLKTFYNELMSEGMWDFNPAAAVKRLREPTNTVVPLSLDEVKSLLAVFRLDDWVELRDYVITSLILDSGLRATEALRIRLDDLHLDEGAIFVPSSNAKGGKARTVYVGAATSQLLKEWLQKRGAPTEWLFPAVYIDMAGQYTPLTRKAFYKRLVKYGQRVGIRHIHPHQLRHSYAIHHLVASGGDLITVARQLGHSSLKVTQRYLNIAEAGAQKILAQQHSLIDSLEKSRIRKRTRIIRSRKLED